MIRLSRNHVFPTIVLLAAMFTCVPLARAAANLLTPVEGASTRSTFDIRSKAQPVKLNRSAIAKLARQDEIDLTLTDAIPHTVVIDRTEDHGGGIRTIVGYLKNHGKDFRVVLTTGPAGSFGSIRTPAGMFQVIPGLDSDLIVDVAAEQALTGGINLGDDILRPPEDHTAKPRAVDGSLAKTGEDATRGTTLTTPTPQATMDLMIVYTKGLADRLGANLMTRLYNLVASANTAYADSEVAITLRLVNATMINYSDTTTDNVALNAITPVSGGGTGVFANIESIRNVHGADFVALLRNGRGMGGNGLAWLSSTSPNPSYTYSVVTGCVVGCNSVFIHELGHNMGNAHDRATAAYQAGGVASPPSGAYPYSFGNYFCVAGLTCNPNLPSGSGGCATQPACATSNNDSNNIGTIMSYFDPVLLKFSNPNITCTPAGGVGRPCGIADTNDNARSMNNMRSVLAALKPTALTALPGALQFLAPNFKAVETGALVVTVSRVGGSSGAVSVNYTTVDNTAKAGYDYVTTQGTLNWADGDSTDKTFTIPILNDNAAEGGENFGITLSSPAGTSGVFLGHPATATVVIAEAWPPGGTLPAGFVTPGSSSGAWTTATDFTDEGTTSLRSAKILGQGGSSPEVNSDLSYTGNFVAGNVTFAYRISSYPDYGQFDFIVDGTPVFTHNGGETGSIWPTFTYALAAGQHTLTWRFRNTLSFNCASALPPAPGGAACADRAWIDTLILPTVIPTSTVTLASSANPAAAGQSVILTATVSGGAGTPTGTVNFKNGGTSIAGCEAVALAGGSAQCTTAVLPVGANSITALYSGSVTYDVATSAALTQNITNASAPPGAPTIGNATPGNGQATIAFTPPASDGGSAITGYTATCNPGAVFASNGFSPITVTGLVNGTPYACSVTATNGNGTGAASATVNVTPSAGAPLALIGVVSRKTHGTTNFEVQINPAMPLAGAVDVEPRGGPSHTVVFMFNNAVTAPGTPATTAGTAAIQGFSGNEVRVALSGVNDRSRATVSLTGVNGAVDAQASLGFLVGDVSNTRSVTASDVAAVKARLGQATGTTTFRHDVNATGDISATDLAAVKARTGSVLP